MERLQLQVYAILHVPEMLKYDGPALVIWLTKLLQAIWNGDPVPVDWK